jgi:hypothetical protein
MSDCSVGFFSFVVLIKALWGKQSREDSLFYSRRDLVSKCMWESVESVQGLEPGADLHHPTASLSIPPNTRSMFSRSLPEQITRGTGDGRRGAGEMLSYYLAYYLVVSYSASKRHRGTC